MTLEFREVPPEEDRPAHLARIRRWYRAYWLMFLPGTLLLLVLTSAAHVFVHSDWVFIVPLFAWIIAIAGVQIRTNRFLCPRCGDPIYPLSSIQVPWDVRCPRCELSISGKPDP